MSRLLAPCSLPRPSFAFAHQARWPLALGVVAACLALALAAGQARAAAEDEEDPTQPQDITLKAADGMEIAATFWPTILKKKKDAVPVILLHAWKGDRGDCKVLANQLHELGHAVIAPDLRGHGESKELVESDGTKVTMDANTLRTADFKAMWAPDIAGSSHGGDMEAVKAFLLKKNNDGELNIERLCVVGAEMGATVAVNWAAIDWAWAPVATGKQGQDVKALVLISPQLNFQGLGIMGPINNTDIGSELSYFIAVGKSPSKPMRDAKNLHQSLLLMHPQPPPDEREAKETLFYQVYNTNLQGMKLLNEKSLDLNHRIARFIELRLVNPKFAWAERKDPLK